MYLVTSPDGVLLGARATLKEVKTLISDHFMTKTREKLREEAKSRMGRSSLSPLSNPSQLITETVQSMVDKPCDPLIDLADPARYAQRLAEYKIEKLDSSARSASSPLKSS